MKKFMSLRKSKKGFTLVELLVVLVIIAILMAAIIPSMMGFINKAKDESASAECRNVLLAANVVLNEIQGTDAPATTAKMDARLADVQEIAGVAGAIGSITVDGTNDVRTITAIASFVASNGSTYAYDATENNPWTKTS